MPNHRDRPERRQAPDISSSPRRRNRSGLTKLIPLLIFLAFGVFILKEQVPAVDDFILSIIQPQRHMAIQQCRNAALAQRNNSDFARVLKGGKATRTQGGFFVERVIVGDLQTGSGEARFQVSCHVGLDGELANVHLEPVSGVPGQWAEPAQMPQTEAVSQE